MGYQRINRTCVCPTATGVRVQAQECDLNNTPLSSTYKDTIQRRLTGLVVSESIEKQSNDKKLIQI
jgi:hypothetical protein